MIHTNILYGDYAVFICDDRKPVPPQAGIFRSIISFFSVRLPLFPFRRIRSPSRRVRTHSEPESIVPQSTQKVLNDCKKPCFFLMGTGSAALSPARLRRQTAQ